MTNNKILVLSDGRAGNDSQAIGLANELQNNSDLNYKILPLSYNFWIFLPNFLLKNSLFFLTRKTKANILNIKDSPKIIISVGRRNALTAYFLRKKFSTQVKIIQIMRPNLNFKNFDLVILPKHDFKTPKQAQKLPKNIILTTGSLGKINDETIKNECTKYQKDFSAINGTKIALLIGGNSKNSSFDKESILDLAKISSKISNNMDATLLILTSRRTGRENSQLLKNNLNCKTVFYDWDELQGKNPYLAILGFSDFFIVTGDSMSMCSECISTGKPTYIFSQKNISSAKHRRFHNDLFLENYAKSLTLKAVNLEIFNGEKLQETKKVANLIISKFTL